MLVKSEKRLEDRNLKEGRRDERPMVSVVVPCFNSLGSISRAVDSILTQELSCEVIVIDDGSTDGSHQYVHKKYGSQIRLICHLRNLGVSYARNLGVSVALGHYIAFLDADDYLTLNSLSDRIHFLEECGADLCYTDYLVEDTKGRKYITAPDHVTERSQFFYNHIATSTVLFNAQVAHIVIMPPHRVRQDWLAWHHFLKNGGSPSIFGVQCRWRFMQCFHWAA